MPVFKLDLVFEANGRGWEETYYRNFPSPLFGDANTVASTLAQKRIALSGVPVVIKAYRVTDPLTEGTQGQPFYFNPIVSAGGDAGANGASSPSAAINVGWLVNAINRQRRIWMRGVWDDAITNFGLLNNAAYATWYAKWLQYRTYVLQQAFGFLSTPRAGTRMRVTYSYAAGSSVPTFTFSGDFFDLAQVNTYQRVRFSKFNQKRSPLNREMVVWVTARNAADAAEAIAAGAQTNAGSAIRYGTPTFYTADNLGIERVGRRAPGSPLLHTPGRASKRSRS